MMRTDRHSAATNRPAGRSAGFTLIEVLVVIVIIILLVSIGAPVVNQARVQGKIATTRAAIGMLEGACRMYENDFEAYPPSFDSGENAYGCQTLALYLTGYPDDRGDDGNPNLDDLFDDDGKNGLGFRAIRRGPVYGPYNGAEKIDTMDVEDADGDPLPAFADAFGNPVLYYRFEGDTYDLDDNDGSFPSPKNPDGKGAASLEPDYFEVNGTWGSTDFVVCTAGPDRVYSEGSDSDDILSYESE